MLGARDNQSPQFSQTKALRAMTMEQRWRIAQNLYATIREWKACALRALHPDWREAQIREAVRRSFLHAGR
ncbi:MAG: hypothetical protein HYV35_06040 [Lentisphaerae bacterium]|nr:hypothetical protein [Lentisphaerota bacterium]